MRDGASQQGGPAARTGLAGFGVAAFAVACCGALPFVAGALGGLALGAWLGIGAGVVALVVAAVALVAARRRRRCALDPPSREELVRPSDRYTLRKG